MLTRSKLFFVSCIIASFIAGWVLSEDVSTRRTIETYSVVAIEDALRLKTSLTEMYIWALSNSHSEEDIARTARAFTALQLSEEAMRKAR